MTFSKRRIISAAVVATATLAAGTGTVVAASTGHTGTSQSAFSAQTENSATTYSPGGGWVTVASTDIAADAGDVIVARFGAESACYGGVGWCAARILVDGNEANPVSAPAADDFAFDSTENNTATSQSYESHSMERVIKHAPSGMGGDPAKVEVQVRMHGANVKQRLDDSILSAVTIKP